MATTKQDQSLSVEQRLSNLYQLQTILSEIDRIRTIRGELPLEVKDLEDNIEGLRTRIDNYKKEIEELRRATAAENASIAEAKSKIDKYQAQIDTVRNNKEYGILSKESLEVELAEKHLGEFARAIDTKKAEIKATEELVADSNHILAEKRNELDEIVNETRQDEENLRDNAKKLEQQFDDERLLNAFKRIRKNARNGLGVVYIQRNACGGCFNRIPPQKQAEIKMRKKIIVCEYCGRILIDPALAGVEEN